MKHYFPRFAALTLSLISGVFTPVVKADESHKTTNITIDRPIEVQDTVLPAGSYIIKLAGAPFDHHLVQIFNAEGTHLITTVFTVPTYQLKTPDSSEFKFYESANGQPQALHTWFYPGDNTGFEFRPGRGAMADESAQSTVNTTNSSSAGF